MEAEIRLLQVLQHLDQERFWSLPDLEKIVQELETRNWGSGLCQNDVLWRRLGRHLVKFRECQQKRIISVLSSFRQDVAQKLEDSIRAFNDYLNSGNPMRLEQLLQAVDDAPQLLYYRHCSDLEARSHFLLALGGAIRAAEGSTASHAATRLRILAGRVAGTFFSVGGTNVLQPWLDARLTGYCRLWQAATESITQRFKEELRDRLASAITRYAALAGKDAGVPSTTPSLKLSGWPMAGCPLAHEFSAFVAEKSPHGALGRWSSLDYQAHTMQPEVLVHVCLSVGELDVDATDAPLARISVSPGLLAKLQTLQTVEHPQPADSPLEPASMSDERVATMQETHPQAAERVGVSVPSSTSQRTVLSFGGSSKPKGSIITTGMLNADGGDSVPQALGFEAATRSRGSGLRVAQESRDAPTLVRRSIDWSDVSFLQRLVRRGLKAEDAGWKQSWEELCEEKQISPSFFPQKPSREVLVEFVEANLCQTTGKAWAQALLYKKEGEDDPAPTDGLSDQDSDPPAVLQSDDIQVSASESSFTKQPSQSAPSTVRLQDLREGDVDSKPKFGSEQESPSVEEPDSAQPLPLVGPNPPRAQSEADQAFPDSPMASKVEPEERVAEEADAALSEAPSELAPGKASKKEKKEKKDKKEKKKDKRVKKEKKEKSDPTTEAQPRETKRQAPQVAIVAAQLDSSSDSSSAEIEPTTSTPPSRDYKMHLCSEFLEGRCRKGSACPAAHSQSELRQPGEAAADFRRQVRSRTVRDSGGDMPPHRGVAPAWPGPARQAGMGPMGMGPGPSQVAMGVHHLMDPLMMGHPAIMTVPFMTPEMVHGPSHYHPMAMIVDPAMVMPKFKEKHEKKSKKERDRDREKQKRKAEKTTDASATTRHEQEKRQPKQKEKVAKRKEKHTGEDKVAAKKERKVDDEDL